MSVNAWRHCPAPATVDYMTFVPDGEPTLVTHFGEAIADAALRLRPARSYIAIPTRPPAEADIRPADPDAITRAHESSAHAGSTLNP